MSNIEGSKYGFPEVIERAMECPEGLDEGDQALVVHMGRYFDRRAAETLRTEMRAKKRAYDLEGEQRKTPFALRNIVDPVERSFVMGNIATFATVHGCTGGCDWCCFDAYLTNDLEVVPLEQKQHFIDELADKADAVGGQNFANAAVSELVLYGDNDPFDDPDVVALMTYVYSKYAITPILSTVLPKNGTENFRQLSEAAAKHKKLNNLKDFIRKFAVFDMQAARDGLKNMNDVNEVIDRAETLRILKGFLSVLENTKDFDRDLVKSILDGNAERYKQALDFLGLGEIDDFLVLNEDKLSSLRNAIADQESRLAGKSSWAENKRYFDRLYEMVSDICKFEGMGDLEFAEIRKRVVVLIDKLRGELDGLPDVGSMRVSKVGSRAKTVDQMQVSDQYHFVARDRDVGTGKVIHSGKRFFDSGKKINGYGISCMNGMIISPFGLMNSVTGNISHAFPQGRMMAPYRGLKRGGVLLEKGADLGSVLSEVIVLRNPDFFDEAPDSIFIYDGDKRIRKIVYDHKTFQVIEDRIVRENVHSLNDLAGLKKTWWGKGLW